MDANMTREKTRPRMTWVTVTDARGRERLEMRWLDPEARPALGTAHAA